MTYFPQEHLLYAIHIVVYAAARMRSYPDWIKLKTQQLFFQMIDM